MNLYMEESAWIPTRPAPREPCRHTQQNEDVVTEPYQEPYRLRLASRRELMHHRKPTTQHKREPMTPHNRKMATHHTTSKKKHEMMTPSKHHFMKRSGTEAFKVQFTNPNKKTRVAVPTEGFVDTLPVLVVWHRKDCALCVFDKMRRWGAIRAAVDETKLSIVMREVQNNIDPRYQIRSVPTYHLVTADPGSNSAYGPGTKVQTYTTNTSAQVTLLNEALVPYHKRESYTTKR